MTPRCSIDDADESVSSDDVDCSELVCVCVMFWSRCCARVIGRVVGIVCGKRFTVRIAVLKRCVLLISPRSLFTIGGLEIGRTTGTCSAGKRSVAVGPLADLRFAADVAALTASGTTVVCLVCHLVPDVVENLLVDLDAVGCTEQPFP